MALFLAGVDRFANDIRDMLGFRPGPLWIICWKFVAPVFIIVSTNTARRTIQELGSIIGGKPNTFSVQDRSRLHYAWFRNKLITTICSKNKNKLIVL